jgi:uncharacterized protein
MRFEWDETKNRINVDKHGINFADVVEMFSHPMLTLLDNRLNYNEERWIGIGWLKSMMGVAVYTERKGDVIRIISARKATKQEVRHYEKSIKN